MKIRDVYLSLEKSDGVSIEQEYTDVIVELDNGKRYISSFFTCQSLVHLMSEHEKTGEFFSGKYFHTPNMVVIENCSIELVTEVIEDMLEEQTFDWAFKMIS